MQVWFGSVITSSMFVERVCKVWSELRMAVCLGSPFQFSVTYTETAKQNPHKISAIWIFLFFLYSRVTYVLACALWRFRSFVIPLTMSHRLLQFVISQQYRTPILFHAQGVIRLMKHTPQSKVDKKRKRLCVSPVIKSVTIISDTQILSYRFNLCVVTYQYKVSLFCLSLHVTLCFLEKKAIH